MNVNSNNMHYCYIIVTGMHNTLQDVIFTIFNWHIYIYFKTLNINTNLNLKSYAKANEILGGDVWNFDILRCNISWHRQSMEQ